METVLYILGAIIPYLLTGLNPAIILSKLIYQKDIRECGSKNPGFTNFKRCFGGIWAYVVLFTDILKGIVSVLIFGILFQKYGLEWKMGIAYSGLFAVIGHVFPVWYKFKGGKGFIVCMAVIWMTNIWAGLIATSIVAIILFSTKYMSLADIAAVASAPITLLFFKPEPIEEILLILAVLIVIIRHKGNIKRLLNGSESKFSFKNN